MLRIPLLSISIAAVLLAGCGQTGNLTLPDKKPAPRPTTATRPAQPATAVTPAPAEDQDPAAKKDDSTSPQP
ncbi:LPS translocon maturation chaperone LptM [Hydrocarboniphaga sp.]|uniref:LPS translocon maturation chaperone LptM n=1 Tax=Hydrocarboniphaga sp. TaxID=2033016 RepID=UPI003D134788